LKASACSPTASSRRPRHNVKYLKYITNIINRLSLKHQVNYRSPREVSLKSPQDTQGYPMNQPTLAHIVETDLGIPAGYEHRPKQVEPGAVIEPPGATLKWYVLCSQRQPVPENIVSLARARVTTTALESRGLGFVILHRCEEDFYFLIVCTWRNSNELWQTVLYKDGEAMRSFERFPREAAHKPTFCVWELVPVWHEQQAWLRFLATARDAPAARDWLRDVYTGPA
jgi:hypothetical protein